jgi:hypothetical protein
MNGLNINVSEEEFKGKPAVEQNWMIYKAIEAIDQDGCRFSRERHAASTKTNWRSNIIIGAGSLGGVGATVFAVWKYVLCK